MNTMMSKIKYIEKQHNKIKYLKRKASIAAGIKETGIVNLKINSNVNNCFSLYFSNDVAELQAISRELITLVELRLDEYIDRLEKKIEKKIK